MKRENFLLFFYLISFWLHVILVPLCLAEEQIIYLRTSDGIRTHTLGDSPVSFEKIPNSEQYNVIDFAYAGGQFYYSASTPSFALYTTLDFQTTEMIAELSSGKLVAYRSESENLVYFLEYSGIIGRRYDLDTNQVQSFLPSGPPGTYPNIAIDTTNKNIFYVTAGQINKMDFSGQVTDACILPHSGTVKRMMVHENYMFLAYSDSIYMIPLSDFNSDSAVEIYTSATIDDLVDFTIDNLGRILALTKGGTEIWLLSTTAESYSTFYVLPSISAYRIMIAGQVGGNGNSGGDSSTDGGSSDGDAGGDSGGSSGGDSGGGGDCSDPTADTDGDGIADCNDDCPLDISKSVPGQCGCGKPDTDSDGDRIADCVDSCPNESGQSEPGPCGCGFSWNPLSGCEACTETSCSSTKNDSDGDGVSDAVDKCPTDSYSSDDSKCPCGMSEVLESKSLTTESYGDVSTTQNAYCSSQIFLPQPIPAPKVSL
ncbi:MAG: hypothetical protein KDD62_04975, partial [Bdellovibrionales bacterium]|nr:hypothetical protein [Bdellovibrionales bacterium]